MDHVKTFFKTLMWTLILLIVFVGGFWAYVRFFDKDLWAQVAQLIYKPEMVECPVCEECEELPDNDFVCDECPEVEECDDDRIDLTNQYDVQDIIPVDTLAHEKLDEILKILKKWTSNIDEPKTQEELLQDVLKRLESLEKTSH